MTDNENMVAALAATCGLAMKVVIEGVTAQLRHAYKQLDEGSVVLQTEFANNLLAPQIERLEKLVPHLDKFVSDIDEVTGVNQPDFEVTEETVTKFYNSIRIENPDDKFMMLMGMVMMHIAEHMPDSIKARATKFLITSLQILMKNNFDLIAMEGEDNEKILVAAMTED